MLGIFLYSGYVCGDKSLPSCENDDLIVEVDRQQNQNARLQRQVDRQMATIQKLRRQIAEAQRSDKCRAAPFSKGKRTSKPRRPGRKPGMGSFSYRKPAAVDELTGPTIDVAVAAES